MGDEPAILQETVDLGPELGQARSASKILCANAVNLLCGPGNRLIRKEEAAKIFRDLELMHQRDSNLHGHFGTAPTNAGAFKIDGRERGLSNGHATQRVSARRSFGRAIVDAFETTLGLETTQQLPGGLPFHARVGNRDAVLQGNGIAQRLAAKVEVAFEHGTDDFAAS